MSSSLKATLILFLIAGLWGLTFPFISIGIHYLSPSVFVLLRLSFAALLFLPVLFKERKGVSWQLIKYTCLLGLFQGLCFLFQTIGLQTVDTANCAFIAASSVIMVPFLAPLFKLSLPRRRDIVAALVSAIGIAVLTGLKLSLINRGDIWAFAAAISYALVINMLQKITDKYSNTALITSLQLIFTLPVPVLLATMNWQISHWSWEVICAIAYCSLMATCVVFYLQTRYQHYVSVTRAAVIYAFEPLFATLFAVWIQHQPITKPIIMGGSLLLVSFMISSIQRRSA
jgi:drug/metabolite transporter (DMT)-like permease